ncbi:MAG: transposase, partial [Candidatus Riflebacteria bacterium]|nr:transposase [Candidatus Riflebacteria bacterium]
MYIKKVVKRNPQSKTTYEYLHLVENIRTTSGPRQRLILNLGSIDISPDQYKDLANCIEGMLSGQSALFSPDRKIEKFAKQAVRRIFEKSAEPEVVCQTPEYSTVDVGSFEASDVRMIGPEHVCHSTWEELGFSKMLLDIGLSRHILPIAEMLVIGRLISPGSELHTFTWARLQSAIFELAGSPLKFSLSALYRTGDFLLKHKDTLETHLAMREKSLFSLEEKICFFDLTNTYFEGGM